MSIIKDSHEFFKDYIKFFSVTASDEFCIKRLTVHQSQALYHKALIGVFMISTVYIASL
jgi:hypothetical protein